ncbi:uncharacterized protein LOC131322931 isoform X1 [Rhododendron vialii]|uniref:uncharacterized protein LOC131322931 isoform X1 n=1 Tax=Rhododendron vialii TaxID=182163 RepID=UPI00265F7D9B|nr:uncharacterized protein LOC131322931 isoform X1 [Rhododendron vialii]
MSFQDRGSWMAKGGGHLTERDTAYDNPSRIEPKRSHQWFTDANEPELFPNKKQAVQAPTAKSTTGILDPDPRPSVNASNFFPSVPSQFMDRLFGGETNRPFNFTEQSVSSVAGVDSNMMRKGINEQFGNDSSVSLSISHTMEDPEICLSYGGFRKVNSNQVKNSDSGFHAPEEHHSGIGQVYNPGNETNFMSSGKGYTKEDESVALMGHTYKGNANIRSVGYAFEKGDDNSLSIGQSYDKGGFNGLSFGGFQQEPVFNPLARPLNSYEVIYDQSSVQTSETPNRGEIVVAPTAGAVVNVSQEAKPKPRRVSAPKNKSEEKVAKKEKEEPNSFPYNVKTLIMTGMLDGMPVKYISPSGQELCGIIKDSGYLCGCQACNFSKVLLPHTFERHAGCKTKQPNNYIYFENGKSANLVVEELRSTSGNELFETIHTVTGSPINEKAFNIWKESYQKARRELQRIYGHNDVNP